MSLISKEWPHVVIVGAGFGGLKVAVGLRRFPVRVTVIDKSNHHLFQPLLYQVATAGLSPADIAAPIRSVLKDQPNTEVLMGVVCGVDPARKEVMLADRKISYDYLVISTGAQYNYFGHDEWEQFAPGLKTILDATSIRAKILLAFEQAEIETDEKKRNALLTFAIVGAGPTGVEMAGSIAELAHKALERDFRHINLTCTEIVLIEAGPRILAAFSNILSDEANAKLIDLGVEVKTNAKVEQVDAEGVVINGQRLAAKTVIWAAGVVASPAGRWLGAEVDRVGRVIVNGDLSVPGHPEVFVIGDTASVMDEAGKPLPGVAPVAMQQGRYVAEVIQEHIRGQAYVRSFQYNDKGNLATVGRAFAIADVGKLHMAGILAWLIWVVVHIFYLIGFRNRLFVMLQWAWAYVTFQRGARLITQESVDANLRCE